MLKSLINLEPETVLIENTCLNIRNIGYYEESDLFITLYYIVGDKEVIRFGSCEEQAAAVNKLEKAFKATYG